MGKINARSPVNLQALQNMSKICEKTSLKTLIMLVPSPITFLSYVSLWELYSMVISINPIASREISRPQSKNISLVTILYSLHYPYLQGSFLMMTIVVK